MPYDLKKLKHFNFSPTTKEAVDRAVKFTREQLCHAEVTDAHLLLGLLTMPESNSSGALRMLRDAGASDTTLYSLLHDSFELGTANPWSPPALSAKSMITLGRAMRIARARAYTSHAITQADLMVAILRSDERVLCEALHLMDVNAEELLVQLAGVSLETQPVPKVAAAVRVEPDSPSECSRGGARMLARLLNTPYRHSVPHDISKVLYYNIMYKLLIGIGAFVGGIAGAYVPVLWGDTDLFSGASILFSVIGGLVGIWLGYLLAKRLA